MFGLVNESLAFCAQSYKMVKVLMEEMLVQVELEEGEEVGDK